MIYFNPEELALVQSFPHKTREEFLKELAKAIPKIEDSNLSESCSRLFLKVLYMSDQEFISNIPDESEADA